MPGAVRLTDTCSGHGCFPSRANSEGSPDVFINGLPAHRLGDAWSTHCCGPACHSSTAASGSPNVFVNDKSLCRIGDIVACTSTMVTGSSDVVVNES